MSRAAPGAVLHDPDEVARRCVAMATGQPVSDVDGTELDVRAELALRARRHPGRGGDRAPRCGDGAGRRRGRPSRRSRMMRRPAQRRRRPLLVELDDLAEVAGAATPRCAGDGPPRASSTSSRPPAPCCWSRTRRAPPSAAVAAGPLGEAAPAGPARPRRAGRDPGALRRRRTSTRSPRLTRAARRTSWSRAAHRPRSGRVAFCGFAPGFGYLTGLTSALHVPPPRRRRAPGCRPARSALAGEFTGVYPRASPGGWQLIGRTDAALWDLDRDPPALLRARRPGPLRAAVRTCARASTVLGRRAAGHRAGPRPARLGPRSASARSGACRPAPRRAGQPAGRQRRGRRRARGDRSAACGCGPTATLVAVTDRRPRARGGRRRTARPHRAAAGGGARGSASPASRAAHLPRRARRHRRRAGARARARRTR